MDTFNKLNCQVTLCNVKIICPMLASINFYESHTFVSTDYMAHGGPFAMAMGAIGTSLLISQLKGILQMTMLVY